MGLCKLNVQIHLWAFILAPSRRYDSDNISRTRHMCSCKEKRGVWMKKCRSTSKSTTHLVMASRAYIVRRARRVSKHKRAKTIAGESLLVTAYFLVYTRKISAIASGATPIGSAGRAPDKKAVSRKNSTKRRRRTNWSL
jgi:hypothetical protein